MARVENRAEPDATRDTLTFVGWNVEQGRKALEAAELVASWGTDGPDVFCMQEVQPEQVRALADVLGMEAYPAEETEASTNNNVIFLKKGGPLVFDANHPQGWAPWHAPANITVRFRNSDGTLSPRTLSLVCGHSCYWSPTLRSIEAEWYQTLAKPDWMTIGLADWNSYREGDGPTAEEWELYEDLAFFANRTVVAADGTRRSDDQSDVKLLDAGYSELARVAVDRLGASVEEALKPASGYREQPGRPPGAAYNVDRGYHTRNLDEALAYWEVRDTEETRPKSDHAPLVAAYRSAALAALMNVPVGTRLPTGRRKAARLPSM